MTLKRLTTMDPFVKLAPGEWWFAKVVKRALVDIKGDKRDTFTLEVYATGKTDAGLPNENDLAGMLGSTPQVFLTGASKGLVDAFKNLEGGKPEGRLFLLSFGGSKILAGGKKYNQWDVMEYVPETASHSGKKG